MTRVFFHAYDHQRRLGGQKHVYQQVDALTAHGTEAYVVHARDGFRVEWFANTTPVVGPTELARLYDREHDVLVLPEDLGDRLAAIPGRQVIFNKGIYNGFKALPLGGGPSPYERPEVIAALAVSEHNARVLRHAYPALSIHVTSPGIDLSRFTHVPLSQKQRRIAWVAKNAGAMATVRHVLDARARQQLNRLGDWSWVQLNDLDEAAMIRVLQETMVVVFLGVEEGYGLTVREAVLCGCIAIAFDGGTLDGLPRRGLVAPADILGVVQRIEAVASPGGIDGWQEVLDTARSELARCSLATANEMAIVAWEAILRHIDRPH